MGSVISPSSRSWTAPSRGSAMVARNLRPARPAARDGIDTDYWLAHCEGYRVDGAEGRIGFVEEVRVGSHHPADTVLAVRMGLLGRRVALIPASAAEIVVPRAERIWLRTPPAILGSEPMPVH